MCDFERRERHCAGSEAAPLADEPGSGRVPGARIILASPRWPLASLASAARADEPGSGRVPGARIILASPRWPLASLASAARADEPGSGRVPGARIILASPRWPLASLASAARADEPGSGRVPGARIILASPRWPLASLASAARADEPGSGRVPGARIILASPRWPLASLASAARADEPGSGRVAGARIIWPRRGGRSLRSPARRAPKSPVRGEWPARASFGLAVLAARFARQRGAAGRFARLAAVSQPPPQLHAAGDQTIGHEHDHDHEDHAEQRVPPFDIGRDHVFHQRDDGGADDRAGERAGTAEDRHQQDLGRLLQRDRVRAEEQVVIDREDSGDRGPESGHDECEPLDQPDIVAEHTHAPRLVAGA